MFFASRLITTLVCVLQFGLTANALEPARTFNVDHLLQLIKDRHITSVDSLISKLPAEIKRNVTFITDSESLQAGSVLNPRAVIWNERGGLVFTFNGGEATQRGNSTLEVMQADPKTGRLHFFEIPFPSGKITEPKTCLQCHGNEPRPIWKEYPNWPSVFGSNDDFTPVEEQNDFQKFIQNAKNHPRFQSLIPNHANEEYPYRSNQIARSTNIHTAFHFRPNLRLNEMLSRVTAKRLASMIKNHEAFKNKKYLLLNALMNCGKPSLPSALPAILKEFDLSIADFDIRNRFDSKNNVELDFVASYFDGSATILEYLLAQLLENDKELSKEVIFRGLEKKYEMTNPRNDLDRHWFPVMDEMSKWMPLPYQKTKLAINVQKREPYISTYRAQYELVCSKIKAAIPADSVSNNANTIAVSSSPILTNIERGYQSIQNRCVKCHSVGSGLPVYENIPGQKNDLQKNPELFFIKIKKRTNPDAPSNYRMPYLDDPLSKEEQMDILDYITSLKKLDL